MKAEFLAIQDVLKTIPELKYIDEDTGQLDNYSPNFPVMFPCLLIDLGEALYDNIGIDKDATPQNRQNNIVTLVFTIANAKLTNTSGNAPAGQKNAAWFIQDVIQKIHEKIHGQKVTDRVGALIRTRVRRIRRDDGVQEYELVYTMPMYNV